MRPDPKVHGDIPGLEVGLLFADRVDVYESGLHGYKEAGIFGTKSDRGAFAIVLNSGYEDDDDQGDFIIYTGEGKGKPDFGQERRPGNGQQGHQDMKVRGNAALNESRTSGQPVRVIRGPDGNPKYCPNQGYRYDGLYTVEDAYMEVGKAGFKMCRFALRRCTSPTQVPLPLHITGSGAEDLFWAEGNRRVRQRPESESNSPRINSSSSSRVRTTEERNREITGHRRLADLGFKRKPAAVTAGV